MKLYELAKSIRSKNAGPFMLTIDILFEDYKTYNKVKISKFLSTSLISEIYNIPKKEIQYYLCDQAKAIKFSFPRGFPAGSFMDSDVFGGQYHSPLVNLIIPI